MEKLEALTNQIANQNLNEHLAVKADEVMGLNRDLDEKKGMTLESEKKCELLERKAQESESHLLTQVKELEGTLSC